LVEEVSSDIDVPDWRQRLHDVISKKTQEREPAQIPPVINTSRLGNLSGEFVKRTLIHLLGDPVRITGSHHVFEGKNGVKYPIPIHQGKTVGKGMMLKCLKTWGILKEFYDLL